MKNNMARQIDTETKELLNVIIEAISEKKGEDIVSLNLSKIDGTVTDFFVITNANSSTQVDAIAHEVERTTREKLKQKVWKKEGYENSQWILLDYGSVVVHVFQTPYREFYKLEELWADAEITNHN